jgi:hypothetical protein
MGLGLWPVGPLGSFGRYGITDEELAEQFQFKPVVDEIVVEQQKQPWQPPKWATDLLPQIVGATADLLNQRKNSLTGLYKKRANLQQKLAKAKNVYQMQSFKSQIAHVETQIRALEEAVATQAPAGAVDTEVRKGNPVPWIIGGLVLAGVVGTTVFLVTRNEEK